MTRQPARAALLVLGLLLAAAGAARAHTQWLLADPAACAPGDTVVVELGSGHGFPVSEEAQDPDDAEVLAAAPGAAPAALAMRKAGDGLTARYVPGATGCHRVWFRADRGVISRTPDGWRDGGRSVWPDADMSLNYFIGGMALVRAGDAAWEASPLGLPLELQAERADGDAVRLRAYRDGAPAAGVSIRVWRDGEGFVDAGETGRDGCFVLEPGLSPGAPRLIGATHARDLPPGADWQRDLFRFNLTLGAGAAAH
jgi:uncharacterized GH25 family protein